MTVNSVTLAQLKKFFTTLFEAIDGMSKDVFQGLLWFFAKLLKANPEMINRQTFCAVLKGKALGDEQSQSLLVPVDTYNVAAITEREKVRNAFAGCVFGGDFDAFFGDTLIEPQNALEVESCRLSRASQDIPIMASIWGRHASTLGTIARLIRAQWNGEAGPLPTDGTWIGFYVWDEKNSEWRAVHVNRYGEVWVVHGGSVSRRYDWYAGLLVFSLAT